MYLMNIQTKIKEEANMDLPIIDKPGKASKNRAKENGKIKKNSQKVLEQGL